MGTRVGHADLATGAVSTLVSGRDFYASATRRCMACQHPSRKSECHLCQIVSLNDLRASLSATQPQFISPRSRLAWVCWDHPNMPWDDTELWVADVAPDGTLSSHSKVGVPGCNLMAGSLR